MYTVLYGVHAAQLHRPTPAFHQRAQLTKVTNILRKGGLVARAVLCYDRHRALVNLLPSSRPTYSLLCSPPCFFHVWPRRVNSFRLVCRLDEQDPALVVDGRRSFGGFNAVAEAAYEACIKDIAAGERLLMSRGRGGEDGGISDTEMAER